MQNKFSRTIKGGILMTGNTLGLSNGGDNINLFTVADAVPPGGSTTTDWTRNSAAGYLTVPTGATVEYALLMWVGTFNQSTGLPNINENITLTPPDGADMIITPDPDNTVIAGSTAAQKMYTQAREITAIVQEQGEGYYKVGRVPSITGNPSVAVGWQIIIVYAHDNDPFRNINVWQGMESVTGTIGTVDVAISGFRTPDISIPKARLIIGASNGDSNLTGDQILFGETVGSLIRLYGPNNPDMNFMCAQINGNDGLLDKRGSFGNNNAPIGALPTSGQRYSFDITNIDISYAVKNNQTSAVVRMLSTGDVYEIFGLALQIDVNQAIIIPFEKSVDKAIAKVGEELTYTFTAKNIGDADAFNTMFTDAIPNGTSFVPNSLTINGEPRLGEDPSAGVSLGILPAFQTEPIIVTFKVIVSNTQAYTVIGNMAELYFQYIPAKGEDPWESTIYSSEAETIIENYLNFDAVKSVDKNFANIGEVLTYTFDLQNTGNVPAEHTVFTDLIPAGLSFVADSLKLNGTLISGNPNAGVSLGNIPVGNSVLSFQARIDNLPPQNPVLNKASFDYDFEVISGTQSPTIHCDTNEVTTKINTAVLEAAKAVDKDYARIGDTLLYTITIINSGSIPADHVLFKDVIAVGSEYVAGSFKLNGTPFSGGGDDPSTGISLGSLPTGQSVVTFQTIVNSIPTPPILSNTAELEYDYTVSPGGTPVPIQTARTNTVVTQINDTSVDFIKKVDKQFADTGEVIDYSFIITNTGTVDIDNVLFTDVVPVDLTYEANSLYINGVQTPGDPAGDVYLGSIKDSATASFKARVGDSLPSPNPIVNQGILRYDYKVDPAEPPVPTVTIRSNQVSTQINHAELTVVETIDKQYVQIGNEILYTAIITNTGNVLCENIFFVDATAIGESFIPDSMTVNGIPVSGNPTTGVNIGNISPEDTVTVAFKTNVDRIPFTNQLVSHVDIAYTYIVDPNRTPVQSQKSSNEVIAYVYNVTVDMTKTADKAFANLGDIIFYQFTITPDGNSSADHVLFKDILPEGLTFVPGSVLINGAPSSGNPAAGIDLGSINTIVNLSFKAQVGNLLPPANPVINRASVTYDFRVDPKDPPVPTITAESNQVSTQINNARLTAIKTVDKAYAKISDELLYTITINNTGNVSADKVYFTDIIASDASYVPGSLMLNGSPLSGTPSAGVNLNSIGAGASATVVFASRVDFTPTPNRLDNSASIRFDYIVNPGGSPVPAETINTNIVSTIINDTTLNALKSVDKNYADVGEQLTYTITLTNEGTISADNVLLTDLLPAGLVFMEGTMMYNGSLISGNPAAGVSLGSINQTGVLTFKAQLAANLPVVNPLGNFSTVRYDFKPDPNKPPVPAITFDTNTVFTKVNTASLTAIKSADKSFVRTGDEIIYTINVTNDGNIPADHVVFTDIVPNGTSYIDGSMTVNGTPFNGDPSLGVSLKSLPVGDTIIKFRIKVYQIPQSGILNNSAGLQYDYSVNPGGEPAPEKNANTNTVATSVNEARLSVVKSADPQYLDLDNVVTYSFSIENTGNIHAENVSFSDDLPAWLEFVPNSMVFRGVIIPGLSSVGVSLGAVTPGTSILSFRARVTGLPVVNPFQNVAFVDYDYKVDPDGPFVTPITAVSNEIAIYVFNAACSAEKTVDEAYSKCGDILTYRVTIKNSGNTRATSVVFTDAIPSGTAFVDDSLMINGVIQKGANPENGVLIGDINADENVYVVFKVKVICYA